MHTVQSETFQTLSIYHTVLRYGIELKKNTYILSDLSPVCMMLPPPCFTVGMVLGDDDLLLIYSKHHAENQGQKAQAWIHQTRGFQPKTAESQMLF